jgi:hypothetical protein
MTGASTLWHITSAERVPVRRPEIARTCDGSPRSNVECKRTPIYVLTFSTNKTGMPTSAGQHEGFTCAEHLHARAQFALKVQSGTVAINPYPVEP